MAVSFQLSISHQNQTKLVFQEISNKTWSLNFPILMLDRSWLKLEKIPLADLAYKLPPDFSSEAPEIIRYHQLINEGNSLLIAAQKCWDEFGMDDFYRALRNCWRMDDLQNYGWTYKKYKKLISEYKHYIQSSVKTIPLIALAQKDSKENHEIIWIRNNSPSSIKLYFI